MKFSKIPYFLMIIRGEKYEMINIFVKKSSLI